MQIVDRIMILVDELGFKNQTEFMRDLELSHTTIARWKKGNTIDPIVLQLIEAKYNVSRSWLRDGVGDMFLSSGREQPFAIDTNNLNYGMLGAILKGIDSFLSDRRSTMPYDEKVELMFTLYAYYRSQAAKSDKVVDLKKYMEKRNVVEDISLLYGTGRA